MAKATIEPPNKKKKGKGEPPPENRPSANLKKSNPGELKPMNFSVPAEFRKEYKRFAVDNDMTMVELLSTSFSYYKDNKESMK